MLLIQILLTLSAIVAIGAGIPQLIKLVKTKNSDEFNLGTWAMWIATQSVSTAYSISIKDPLLITINAAWVLFYFVMTVLIVRYSPRLKRKIAPAAVKIEPATVTSL